MTNNSFKIEDDKVIFESGELIQFDYRVSSFIVKEDIIVVVLSIPGGTKAFNNAFGINLKEKKIIWQLENNHKLWKPFNTVSETKTGEIGLRGPFDIIIDPQDGKILEFLPGTL